MKKIACSLVVVAGLAALNTVAAEIKPLRVLLITGGCCHDYAKQKDILKKGLEARANIEVTQIHTDDKSTKPPLAILGRADYAAGYDVVLHDECAADVSDPALIAAVLAPHRAGVPGVNLHCAMHSYRIGNPNIRATNGTERAAWFEYLGLQSSSHGPQEPIAVNFVDAAHPIAKGFTNWTTMNEELYNNVQVLPTATPLAKGKQTVKQRDGTTKEVEAVVAWANNYGGTRVFSTTLGHNNGTVADSRYLALVTRGVLWACGKLQPDGTPQPGFGPQPAKSADWSRAQKFPATERVTALFNGTDTKGWTGKMKYWSVQDGIIIGKNGTNDAPKASTYLTTAKKFRNFRLVFEGKLVTSEMHSGVSLWGESVEKESDPHSYMGHLVMFPNAWGYWDLYRRNSIYKDDGRAKKAGRQHDWNQMEILAIGSRIRFAVNGQLVADWTDPKPELCKEGPIGLQLHSNKVAQEVHFRGLLLSEDPEDRMVTVKE